MKPKKNAGTPAMDEREQLIWLKSMERGYLFLQLCLMGLCIYHLATKNDSAALPEFLVLIGSIFVVLISQHTQGAVDTPIDQLGEALPLGRSGTDRRSRLKAYLKGALLISFLLVLFQSTLSAVGFDQGLPTLKLAKELLSESGRTQEILLAAALEFAVTLPFMYLVQTLVGENQVRRYNQKIDRLDREDAEEIPG